MVVRVRRQIHHLACDEGHEQDGSAASPHARHEQESFGVLASRLEEQIHRERGGVHAGKLVGGGILHRVHKHTRVRGGKACDLDARAGVVGAPGGIGREQHEGLAMLGEDAGRAAGQSGRSELLTRAPQDSSSFRVLVTWQSEHP